MSPCGYGDLLVLFDSSHERALFSRGVHTVGIKIIKPALQIRFIGKMYKLACQTWAGKRTQMQSK